MLKTISQFIQLIAFLLILVSCEDIDHSEISAPMVSEFNAESKSAYGIGDTLSVSVKFEGSTELSEYFCWIEGNSELGTSSYATVSPQPTRLESKKNNKGFYTQEVEIKYIIPNVSKSGNYEFIVRVSDKLNRSFEQSFLSVRILKPLEMITGSFAVQKGISGFVLADIDSLDGIYSLKQTRYDENETYPLEKQKKADFLIGIDYKGDEPVVKFYSTFTAHKSGKYCSNFSAFINPIQNFKINPISENELNEMQNVFKLQELAENSNAEQVESIDIKLNSDLKNGIVLVGWNGHSYVYIHLKVEEKEDNQIWLHQKYVVVNE